MPRPCRELIKQQWNKKMTVIPIIVGELRTILNKLEKKLAEIDIRTSETFEID